MMFKLILITLVLIADDVLTQDDYDLVEECPEKFGFYADAVQCDRYYECQEGQVKSIIDNIPHISLL